MNGEAQTAEVDASEVMPAAAAPRAVRAAASVQAAASLRRLERWLERGLPFWSAAALAWLSFRLVQRDQELLYGLLVDDAYISARHARVFVEGGGLNFNHGQPIEGYTNFLFTALMVIPHAFQLPLEAFVRAVGFVSALGVVFFTWRIGKLALGVLPATLACLALVLDQRFVFFATWGLETVFVALPCLVGYFLSFRGRPLGAGMAFTAALLTRMDMALVMAPALLAAALPCLTAAPRGRRARRALLRLMAPIVLGFGSYFAIRWAYYGWPLPNTFYAKVGSPLRAYERGLSYLAECFSAMGVEWVLQLSALAWAALSLLWLTSLGRAKRLSVQASRCLSLAGAAVAYWTYVVLVGGDHFQERFIYHALPFLLFFCAAPWALWASVLRERLGVGRWLVALAPSLVLLVVAQSLARQPHRFGRSDNVAAWVSLGQFLARHAAPGSVLATDAAGALPYYSGLETIDVLGLADPVIAHKPVDNLGAGVAGHEKADPKYVLGRQPEYISTWLDEDGRAGRGFRHEPSFDEHYRLAALVRTDSTEVSQERVLPFKIDPPYRERAALVRGVGKVAGRYPWALYQRRHSGDYRRLDANRFYSNLPGWQRHPEHVVHAPRGHTPSHVLYGPFVALDPGPHDGFLRLRAGTAPGLDPRQRLCGFDVFDGSRTIVDLPVTVGEVLGLTVDFPFSFQAPEGSRARYEFRLYCWGLADVTVLGAYVR